MATTLGTFEQAALLAVVRLREQAYGRAILRDIQARLERPVAPGAVHVTLNRLENRGLLSSSLGVGTAVRDGRPRRCYTLTGAGRVALNDAHSAVHALWRGFRPLEGEA